MRTLLYSLLILALACNAQSADQASSTTTARDDSPAESPNIQVRVTGAPAGRAYVIGVYADQNFRLDSTQVSPQGEAVLQRAEPYPAGMYFLVFSNNSYVQMLIDKDQTFSLTTDAANPVGNMQVEGSVDNDILYQSLKFEAEWQPRLDAVNQQLQGLQASAPNYASLKQQQDALLAERKAHLDAIFEAHPNSLFTAFKRAGQNPDLQDVRRPDGSVDNERQVALYRRAFWDNVDLTDTRLLHTPVIGNKLKRYIKELTPQRPDSIKVATDLLVSKVMDQPEYYQYFVNWIALQYEPTKTTLMDPEAVYVHMVQKYFTYDKATWSDSAQVYALQLRANEMANSLVGNKGPNVQAKDPSGQLRSLYDLKAPYVIVYMFNPTCEHCMEETPKLVQFYQQWKNQGVDVFGIAIDTDQKEWTDYIAKTGMPWTNVFDPTNRAIYAKYYVDITPEIYVLDPDRTIIAKNLKVNQIAEVIERDRRKRQ